MCNSVCEEKMVVNMYFIKHHLLFSVQTWISYCIKDIEMFNFGSISSGVHNHLTNVPYLLFDRLPAWFVWSGKETLK